jgi:large subunit ribosomal protein L32
MAVPKYRTSRSKARTRRAHSRIEPTPAAECSHCHELKLAHRVCPNCGYYNGRPIVVVGTKE